MIVALLNQKGGVGKTTLATHIAGELAMRGQHVVLLDADPQGSALDWTQRRSQQGLPRLFSAVVSLRAMYCSVSSCLSKPTISTMSRSCTATFGARASSRRKSS